MFYAPFGARRFLANSFRGVPVPVLPIVCLVVATLERRMEKGAVCYSILHAGVPLAPRPPLCTGRDTAETKRYVSSP
ncbi:hypothetical protein E2C01_045066 [Portunus trituberculatus]|uniref:Uncharacterized protein n=1 Tax=Portunus trituberculatus TaxID=210409 RepID=A0A5B7G1U0_PORTR|nr:hypothetical protein [Portunus trituberculatus]